MEWEYKSSSHLHLSSKGSSKMVRCRDSSKSRRKGRDILEESKIDSIMVMENYSMIAALPKESLAKEDSCIQTIVKMKNKKQKDNTSDKLQ